MSAAELEKYDTIDSQEPSPSPILNDSSSVGSCEELILFDYSTVQKEPMKILADNSSVPFGTENGKSCISDVINVEHCAVEKSGISTSKTNTPCLSGDSVRVQLEECHTKDDFDNSTLPNTSEVGKAVVLLSDVPVKIDSCSTFLVDACSVNRTILEEGIKDQTVQIRNTLHDDHSKQQSFLFSNETSLPESTSDFPIQDGCRSTEMDHSVEKKEKEITESYSLDVCSRDSCHENKETDTTLLQITDSSSVNSSQEHIRNDSQSLSIHSPNGLSDSLFNHPAYKTVIKELAYFREQIGVLQSEINRLEGENQRLEADRSHEIYLVQLETLEKTIGNQQRELKRINELSRQQAEVAAKNYSQMKHDLEGKLERLTKQYETANKERESMVMRYAISEKEVINQKKELETLDKKLKESVKEKELLMGKLKSLTSEKARLCQLFDSKCHELTSAQKENEKLREELNSREIKIKWAQNKLRSEMDLHKETQIKVDKLTQKLQESREETELVRKECQESIRAFQESQENKAYTLGLQLKEEQAKLIMERHEREDKEESCRQLQQEVDNLKRKHQLIIEENNVLSVKVQNLEKERLEYEQNLSKLKRSADSQRQNLADLQSQLTEMEALRIQKQHEQEKLTACQAEVERLRSGNEDLLQEMAACREREAELLDFTQKLTDKNVRLQSEFSATEAKAQQLEYELGPLQRRLIELETEVSSLKQQLEQEQQQRHEESQLLARHLAERTQRADQLAQQLADQEGENQLLRRKQVTITKELTRELQQCRKRLEQYESSSGSNSLGQGSRASSCASLNALSDGNFSVPTNGNNGKHSAGQGSPAETNNNQQQQQVSVPTEPDRQMLIERIVKLQRANARKQEKLEFMEEHARQLVSELQKKTHIIQSYIMREQSGALSSDTMDQNKAELTRHGGIMASLYTSRAVDSTMTLELSLEINKKLQAVLEDTLLKNITLKENIDTLGMEISRLTMQMNSAAKSS
ncbi:coiled-coil domain-containing protein 186 [Anabrus simplex]|uniref:coiled-coil domain-containing protein 186 n=1 Tax=Anabrus simplex TaxID=316456 RepID=UPI0035A344B9